MKRRVALVAMFICVAAVTLAACDGQSPQPTPVGPTPTTAGPAGNTITYATTGGIAGVRRELIITGASATLTDGGATFGPVTLSDARVNEIQTKLDASNFTDLEERYGTGTVADDFLHTLTVAGADGTKSVTVEEVGGKDSAPQALQELLALMASIEEEVRQLATTTPTPNPAAYEGRINFTSTREATNERLEMAITPEGEATIVENGQTLGTVQVEPEMLELIRDKLANVDFFNLKAYYGTGRFLPNDRVLVIRLQADGKSKMVSMEQNGSVEGTPSVVQDLFMRTFGLYNTSKARALGTPAPTP